MWSVAPVTTKIFTFAALPKNLSSLSFATNLLPSPIYLIVELAVPLKEKPMPTHMSSYQFQLRTTASEI